MRFKTFLLKKIYAFRNITKILMYVHNCCVFGVIAKNLYFGGYTCFSAVWFLLNYFTWDWFLNTRLNILLGAVECQVIKWMEISTYSKLRALERLTINTYNSLEHISIEKLNFLYGIKYIDASCYDINLHKRNAKRLSFWYITFITLKSGKRKCLILPFWQT